MDKQTLNIIYDKVGDKKSRYQSIDINHTRPLNSDSLSTTFKDIYQGNEQWKVTGNQNKLSNNLENYSLNVNQAHKVNFLVGELDVKHNVKYPVMNDWSVFQMQIKKFNSIKNLMSIKASLKHLMGHYKVFDLISI